MLENDKLKVIPKEDVNDLWKQERAKLMLRQENERNAVIECKDKIEKKERTTMKKQLDVTKEKYKLHRFDNFYKGDQGISFDEEEFLRYINRGPLRLRHHKAKLPYYQELSRSIDSTSRKSYRDSSLDKSTDRSNFNYDQHDTHSSMSPRKPARKIISVNTLSDSKVSHGSKYRPTDDNTRDDGKVSLIDWTDAVFVVPKGNKPRYLNKHVYDVDPSPIFDPATSNKPRESSQERADKVIRYFDEATGRSSRESSPGKSPIKQSRKSPIRQSRKNPNDDLKNGVSRKNGQNSNSARSDKSNSDKKGSSTSKHQKQSQREASQTGGIKDQSEIDIYYEEEDDEIDPNTAALALKASQSGTIIVIKDKLTGKESLQVNHKTTGDQEIATSPILEPAFETSEIFQALSDYVTQIKMEESSTFEPAFETREVYEALSSFVIGIKVPDTSSLEPAFETKEIFSALSTFVTEMQVPNIEPAFESSDIYQALAKFVNEIEVKTVEPAFESREVYEALAKFVTEIKVKSVEPAFESRDLFKALTSIARPTQQKPGEVAEPAPKTQAASETRAFLRAFKGLSGLKVSQPPSDSHAVTKEVIDSPDFKTKVIRRVQATINPSSAE